MPIKRSNILESIKKNTIDMLLKAFNGSSHKKDEIEKQITLHDSFKANMEACCDHSISETLLRSNTVALGTKYLSLSSEEEKLEFFETLATDFTLSPIETSTKLEIYISNTKQIGEINVPELLRIAEAPYISILRKFIALPQGLKFLIDMRADLIHCIKTKHNKAKKLVALEYAMKCLLESWFDVGLLDMKRITWDSPASLLEKLIAYEAVHRILSWYDLKNRLEGNKLCFAFFHYKIQKEPLIFVEVALSEDEFDGVKDILDPNAKQFDPNSCKFASFYSISNTQKGLTGINMGNFLIKKVVSEIQSLYPKVKTFMTVSPIPGFSSWLEDKQNENFINERSEVLELINPILTSGMSSAEQSTKELLLSLCAQYLLTETDQHKALDPVTHFHLSNGAAIYKLRWDADRSEKGLKNSYGIMVNYLYKTEDLEKNYALYSSGKGIPASKDIRDFAEKYD